MGGKTSLRVAKGATARPVLPARGDPQSPEGDGDAPVQAQLTECDRQAAPLPGSTPAASSRSGARSTSARVKRYLASSTRWRQETQALREILLAAGLDEDIKWGKLCYAQGGNNVAIIQKMKSILALMFFKGALLADSQGILEKPGENSRSGRRFEFTSAEQIAAARTTIHRYVREAIGIEEAGLKVPRSRQVELPAELQERFERDPAFKEAFEALTPGRQRGYAIYFAAAVKSETRERRIDKYARKILDGKGFHDP